MARGTWRLPGYRIESLIGAGSSGEVWRATVTSTGVPVALKRIWLSERAQRDAAIGEAAMLSTLDHAHLMKLHEVRTADDSIVLVLDLAAAGSLATLLARRGRLTPGEVVTALAPIGSALAYTHNREVVHGDVSAANILFTGIGLPLLADLGVARLLGGSAPVRTTPSYADPTVAAGGPPLAESDVFMLGGVALHALTGAPPWPGSDAAQVLEQAAATGEQPDFAAQLAAADVPARVAEVVVRALEFDPARRGTAADFALDLRHAATPVAVELNAGRARHGVDTMQSWPLQSWPLQSVPSVGETPDDGDGSADGSADGPPFARLPLTYGVRAPVPFTRPPGARHQARRTRSRRLLVAVALMAIVAAAVLTWWPDGAARSRDRSAHGTDRAEPPAATPPASAGMTSPPPATAPATAGETGTPAPRASGVARVLAVLDTARARAFATRDPGLLTRVYASPVLIARDRAMLLSRVPPGCGLTGLHSTFRATRVARHGPRVEVRTTVSVRAGDVVCRGSPAGHGAPAPPVRMTIVLRRVGGGYRIESERTERRLS